MRQWLFYANSTRFASAMSGADYGVYANGRFFLASNVEIITYQEATICCLKHIVSIINGPC